MLIILPMGASGTVNDVVKTVGGFDDVHLVALIALVALVSVPTMLYLIRRPSPKTTEEVSDPMENAVALVTTTMQPVLELSRNIARQNELQEETNRLKAEEIKQQAEQLEAQRAGWLALSEKTIKEAHHTTEVVESGLQGQTTLIQALSENIIKSNQTVVESVERLAKQIETQAAQMPTKDDFAALLVGVEARINQTLEKGYQAAQEAPKTEAGESQSDPSLNMAKVIEENV